MLKRGDKVVEKDVHMCAVNDQIIPRIGNKETKRLLMDKDGNIIAVYGASPITPVAGGTTPFIGF